MRLAGSWHDHEMTAADLGALGLLDEIGRPIGRTLATIRCAECPSSQARRVGAVALVDGYGPVAYSDGARDDGVVIVRWKIEPAMHRIDFDAHPLACRCPRHGLVTVERAELQRWFAKGAEQRNLLAWRP